MKLRQRIAAIVATVLLGIGGAVALEAPASASTYGHYIVHASGLCLEVPNYSVMVGEQLVLNQCTGTPNQYFYFEDAGYDWAYYIHPNYSNRYCLMPGSAALPNSTIIQWRCDYGSRQVWTIGSSQSSGLILKNVYSGMCLGVDYAYAGAYVRQGSSCIGSYRTWTL